MHESSFSLGELKDEVSHDQNNDGNVFEDHLFAITPCTLLRRTTTPQNSASYRVPGPPGQLPSVLLSAVPPAVGF